jgi:hypothetical protein
LIVTEVDVEFAVPAKYELPKNVVPSLPGTLQIGALCAKPTLENPSATAKTAKTRLVNEFILVLP